tara:strand:+ start:1301 stop:3577 length:2277 start_codon:yes stop_codon:yes gene_type:complete
MTTLTQTPTTNSEETLTMREFFDKYKIPYAIMTHEFYEENGVKKKRIKPNTPMPPKNWQSKYSYEVMMGINDANRTSGDTTIVAYLRNSPFCVLDADTNEAEDYLYDNYNHTNWSESICRQMMHLYVYKDIEDKNGKNIQDYLVPGLDVCYCTIFEKIDAPMNAPTSTANMQIFKNFKQPQMPTNTPASQLDKKERIFDPAILDIISSEYFNKGKYNDWLKICWAIIYCWGEIEGRLLCLKYSMSDDYTESETNLSVEKLLYNYNPTKNTPTFGSLCHYAKESDEPLYDKWRQNNIKEMAHTIRDVALKMNLAELKPRISRCDNDYYFKPDTYKPDWVKGADNVKRALRRDIIYHPDKYDWYLKARNSTTGEIEYCLKKIDTVKCTDECVRDGMDMIEDDPHFINNMWENSLGKICFNNGVYNFKSGTFEPYGLHNTLIKVDRDFLPPDPIIRQDIYDRVINPIFGDDTIKRDAFLYNMGVAMAGDITFKKWIHCQGERGCGKGVMCDFMRTAFGAYVREINTSCFYKKTVNGDKDEAKAKSFMLPLQHARLVYANEVDAGIVMNGTSIKAFCSGGDHHQVRANYKDEVDIRLQSMLMIMSNDYFKISPVDAMEKLVSYDMKSVFLTGDENEERLPGVNYQNADMSLRLTYLSREDIKNEICHIVFDAYKNRVIYTYKPPIQDEESISVSSIIKESFKVSPLERVSNKDIREFIASMKLATSLQKVNKYISSLFPSATTYKSGGDRGWDGIGLIYDDE